MKRSKASRQERRRVLFRQALRVLWDYVLIAIGATLVALAADLFVIPNKIVSGGVVGIATLLHYLIGTPVGVMTLVINIPLLIAGAIWTGGFASTARTIWGVLVLSISIDLLAPYLTPPTHDPILYTLYGGLLDGLGIGLVFLARGTTGGTDIIAQLMRRWFGFKLGHTLLLTSILILSASSLVFGIEPVMYAILIAYISTRVVDLVQEGSTRSRSAIIITQEAQTIKQQVVEKLGRGMTVMQGEGAYTGNQRTVLLCAVSQSEVSRLKRIVNDADEHAFVILFAASEVLGEGFTGMLRRRS